MGKQKIHSLRAEYGLTDGKKNRFEWEGELEFMETADIILVKPSWKGLENNEIFQVEIQYPNGMKDDHPENNRMTSRAGEPMILPEKFVLHVKTQGFGRAADNSCRIIDEMGEVAWERQVYEDDSTYHDKIKLKKGAYRLTFTDKNEDGMIRHWWLYWEDPKKVGENGELKLLDSQGELIMDLGYDWAEKRELQFFVGEPR
jgi:hypothetical protein